MLKFRVFKITLETMKEGTFEFEAEGVISGEKGLYGTATPYRIFYHDITAHRLACRIVGLQKKLAAQENLVEESESRIIIEFPKNEEIHQPLNGISKVRLPLSGKEIIEFWRYLREWRDSHGDHCET